MYSLIDVNLYWINLYWLTYWLRKGKQIGIRTGGLGTPYVIEIMFAFSPRTPFPFFLALLCFAIAERNRVSLKERSAPPPSPFRRIYQKLAKGHHPNLQKPASLSFRFCIARCVRLCVAMLWPLSLSLSEIEGDGRRKGRGRRKKEEGREMPAGCLNRCSNRESDLIRILKKILPNQDRD